MKKPLSAKDRLIFALDVQTASEAAALVRALDDQVGVFKVGLELFVREGSAALKAVTDHSSAGLFLDLKLHDIPATMRGALKSASNYRARFITVHCETGACLVQPGDAWENIALLGITVLTSIGENDLPIMGIDPKTGLRDLVLRRAQTARAAGCSGVVCSGQEARAVKQLCGNDFWVITPGIRPDWSGVAGDDQARAATPAGAITAGADFIVVGRPIREASKPADAARRIVDEIEQGLRRLESTGD